MKQTGLLANLANMQKKMSAIQTTIANSSFSATAAGGLVAVQIAGTGKIASLSIDSDLLKEDASTVADCVMAAVNAANDAKEAALKEACKGLGINGLQLLS